MLDDRKFKVLEVEGKDGLTVGSKVLKPGATFGRMQWPYGDDSLENAIETKRCVEITEKKEEPKKSAEKKAVKENKKIGEDK